MVFYGKHLMWNFAHCVYILASSAYLYKLYIINKVFTEFSDSLLKTINSK